MEATTSYDLFIKKSPVFPVADATTQKEILTTIGAAGLTIELEEARKLKQRIRANGGAAVIFPAAYRIPKYGYQEAFTIASNAYQTLVAEDPSNYGPLELYDDNPVYWFFSADNYALQAEGYAPGRNAFSVDKLTGELLSESELKKRFGNLQKID